MSHDVDAGTWIASLLSAAAFGWIILVDLRRYRQQLPVRAGMKRLLLWAGAAGLVFWGARIWSNASAAPHAETTGVVQPVQRTFYHGDGEGMIACVQDCRTLLLNFTPEAADAVRDSVPGTAFRIGYLDQRKEVYPNVFGAEVVDVWDASGAENLYHFDTGYHPRLLLLLATDALLLIIAGVICARISSAEPDPEETEAEEEEEPEAAAGAPEFRPRQKPAFRFSDARDGAEPAD